MGAESLPQSACLHVFSSLSPPLSILPPTPTAAAPLSSSSAPECGAAAAVEASLPLLASAVREPQQQGEQNGYGREPEQPVVRHG